MEPAAAPRRGITVFVLGAMEGGAADALDAHFEVEQRSSALGPDAALGSQQSTLRAEVNLAGSDWILLLREGERVSGELAREIESVTADPPRAWGFRLRTVTTYGGKPLRMDQVSASEIRLYHRRHARFDLRDRRKEMNVEGAVVRLASPLLRAGWSDSAEHRAFLRENAVPHSFVRRALLFLNDVVRHRALFSAPTLRYLWIEAGWDRAGPTGAARGG